jgi:hypothetical protein
MKKARAASYRVTKVHLDQSVKPVSAVTGTYGSYVRIRPNVTTPLVIRGLVPEPEEVPQEGSAATQPQSRPEQLFAR